MNDIKIFESADFGRIRVCGTSEQPKFCLADVCKVLGLENSAQVKTRLDDGVISNEVIYDSLGRKQNAVFVNEDGFYDVVLDSRKPNARDFRKWITGEVVPSIRKYGSYSLPTKNVEAIDADTALMRQQMAFADWAAQSLRLDANSVLRNAHVIADRFNIQGLLPDYTTPKDVHFSATELLKKYNVSMSARQFNKKMVELGYLEVKTRPSSKGTASFYSVSEKGAQYGINQSCPKCPNETQPHWYEHSFSELITNLNNQPSLF